MVINSILERHNLSGFKEGTIKNDNSTDDTQGLARTGRLQLLLPENSVTRLSKLKDVTEAASYAEVIRRALRIYEALLAEQQSGNEIVIRHEDGSEITVPARLVLT